MSRIDMKSYWAKQSDSFQRHQGQEAMKRKAQEHFDFMRAEDRVGPVIDFACGAGELLSEFAALIDVDVATDWSQAMLDRARARLGSTSVELVHSKDFDLTASATQSVWTTCGGLNQYLPPQALEGWLNAFCSNESAHALYLFDCIDPIRRNSIDPKSMYIETKVRPLRRRARRTQDRLRNLRRSTWADLGSPAMGYGYTPEFFRALASKAQIDVHFGSSRDFEYRFHAGFSKLT